jgi:hypothetical protein
VLLTGSPEFLMPRLDQHRHQIGKRRFELEDDQWCWFGCVGGGRRRALRDPGNRSCERDRAGEHQRNHMTILHDEPPETGRDATPTRRRRGTGRSGALS